MDYFINEYSLRGQFDSIDQFFESLRNYTIPVLKKIEQNKESIIWKKEDLWNAKICGDITLFTIPQKKNERTQEKTLLLNKMMKLMNEEPYFSDREIENIIVKKYYFDDEYNTNFAQNNCFICSIKNEGRIISFEHEAYKEKEMSIDFSIQNKDYSYTLDNIWALDWWDTEPTIIPWTIQNKYKVQVRAKEFDYHPPHFHVLYNDKAAVFKLSDGTLYQSGNKNWTTKEISMIQNWYMENKEKLIEAWDSLHKK